MSIKATLWLVPLFLTVSLFSQEHNENWAKAANLIAKQEYAEALPYFRKADKDFSKNGESFYQAKVWGEYLHVFQQLGQADSLKYYENLGYELLNSDDVGNRAKAYMSQRIGKIEYYSNGNYEASQDYFNKALKLYKTRPEESKKEILSCLYDNTRVNQYSNYFNIAD